MEIEKKRNEADTSLSTNNTLNWLAGGGEMTRIIATKDWSETSLGPIQSWSTSLRTTVSLCLASNFPINIIWGPRHVQIYNDGYRIVCGAVHPRALGESFTVTWASAWPAIGKAFERALAGETSFLENQRMFLERNGYQEETFFTFSMSPIRDESGKVVGLFHPCTETTAAMISQRRTRALRDIAERAGKSKSLKEACHLVIETLAGYYYDVPMALLYEVEPDGKATKLVQCTGVKAGQSFAPQVIPLGQNVPTADTSWPLQQAAIEMKGKHVQDLVTRFGSITSGEYPEPLREAFVLPLAGIGQEQASSFLIVGLSPRLPFSEAYAAFIRMLADAVTAALNSARGYEEERRRAEALEELDRAKTVFFSNISHEFRTPLTLILGPVEDALASSGKTLSGDQLDLVRRNVLRLYKLVNTLLDFSRMEAGRAQAAFVPTNFSDLTADLASHFRSAAESAGLKLVVDCPSLPEAVYLDPEMWEKVVLNLLSNAVKYTYSGEIRISTRFEGSEAVLSVQDTGIGIPEDELPRIFQRFYRVQKSEGRSHEGTGIGLAFVQELVKLHGGKVEVQSQLGSGTTFCVRIPRGKAHLPLDRVGTSSSRLSTQGASAFVEEAKRWSSDAPPAAPALIRVDSPSVLPKVPVEIASSHILLADDNADLRSYVAGILRSVFASVESVNNGKEALEAVQKKRPDLILSDVMMPVLDGFGLIRQLRSDPKTRTIPIILLSARAGDESAVEGLKSGADDYLVKPFSARELIARIKTRIEMDRIRREAARHEQEKELLRQAVHARDEFLSVASHELKTPITSLKLQLQMTKRRIKPELNEAPPLENLAHAMDNSLKQTERLKELVEDLLDTARIQAGKLTYNFEPVNVRSLIHEVVSRYHDPLEVAQCTVQIEVSVGLRAYWDRSRIEQVIVNLLSNAAKYSSGTPIHIRAITQGEYAVITVQDFGPGIPKERQSKIFDRFERAVSSRNISGLGLGLFIVNEIVKGHEGFIRVESEPGKGAKFIIELPFLPSKAKNVPSSVMEKEYGT